MLIRRTLLAAAMALATLSQASAGSPRPLEAKDIDLGEVAGIAYYTSEADGFHVVTTLAEGDAGTPIRIVSVLAPGQRVVVSTAHALNAIEISRNGDNLLVRKTISVSN